MPSRQALSLQPTASADGRPQPRSHRPHCRTAACRCPAAWHAGDEADEYAATNINTRAPTTGHGVRCVPKVDVRALVKIKIRDTLPIAHVAALWSWSEGDG